MRRTILMPPADGVAAGNRPTFRLPIGQRYHNLFLVLSGVTVAQIAQIVVKVNNDVIHRYSGTVRNRLNKFFGLADAAEAVLQIPFDRINLLAKDFMESTAINTNVADANGYVVSSLTVELALAAGAYTPVIDLYAETSDAKAGGPGDVQRILGRTLTAPAIGENQFILNDSQIGDSKHLLLDWAFFDTADIDKLEIEIDNNTRFRRTADLNNYVQANGKRVPDANAFVVDTSENGYGTEVLPLTGLRDFRYIAEMSGSGAFDIYEGYIGRLK